MNKSERNRNELLGENWDTDASASDNESFEIEMMQDESLIVSDLNRTDSTEK